MSRDRRDTCETCNGTGKTPRRHYVYVVFGENDECLYVGRTAHIGEFGGRWQNHRYTNPEMHAQAKRFRLLGPYPFNIASDLEIEHQIRLRPRYGVLRATRKASAIARRIGIDISDLIAEVPA